MKPVKLEPLSAETERLLALERPIVPDPDELRARAALERVGTPPARGGILRRRAGLLMAAALVMTLAAVSFAAWQHGRAGAGRPVGAASPAGATSPAESVGLVGGVASAPAQSRPSVDASLSEQSSGQEPVEPAKRSVVPAAPSPPDADSAARELALLERARAAVASREFSTALGAIAEHQRRFPAGRLQEEREALRIRTLVALGRKDEARRVAERFRSRFPRSVLLARIEAAMGQPP
jgi:hypothetical protein